MAASIAGRKCQVYFSLTNGAASYHLVHGIDTVTGGPVSPEITDDEFGIEYEQSLTGIRGLPFTLSGGSRRGSDSLGQDAIIGSELASNSPNGYLAVLFDGSGIGWKGAVNFSKISPDTKVRDKWNISFEGKTTGAFTIGAISLP